MNFAELERVLICSECQHDMKHHGSAPSGSVCWVHRCDCHSYESEGKRLIEDRRRDQEPR